MTRDVNSFDGTLIARWIEEHQPFSLLPQSERDELLSHVTLRDAVPGESLLEQRLPGQDIVWGVVTGELRIFDDSSKLMDESIKPGELCGISLLLDQKPLRFHALAAVSTRCLGFPVAVLRKLCDTDPKFASFFASAPLEKPNLPEIGGWVGGPHASPYAMIAGIEREWGRVLDAGTGDLSLSWLISQPAARCTAITYDDAHAEKLRAAHADKLRTEDRVIAGDWRESGLLQGEVFDVVLADYLVGALERFTPYFQYEFFPRLRPHVGRVLYLVGTEPEPEDVVTEGAGLIKEVHRVRDAILILLGERPYREYPSQWVLKELGRSGFRVEGYQQVGKIFGVPYLHGVLSACLHLFIPALYEKEPQLAIVMAEQIAQLRERIDACMDFPWGCKFGQDYLVVATPG